MHMPDFDEFRKTLSEDKMTEFFGADILNIYQMENLSPENVNALISKISIDIMARSANYTLNLLQAYHEWLSEQLSE